MGGGDRGGEDVRQWEGPVKASELSLSNRYIQSYVGGGDRGGEDVLTVSVER